LGKAYARRYPRHTLNLPVDYSVGEQSYRGTAKTLSGGGLFLTSIQGLEVGLDILLRFRPAKHLPAIHTPGRVLYVMPEKGAGVEFTDITPDDRHAILRFIHQKNRDRRLNPRAPLATQVQCDQCMSLALSRDISLGGMFVETTDPLPLGAALTIRFNLDGKDQVVAASAQVTYHIEKMGMGIVFTDLGKEESEAIRKYLESAPTLPAHLPAKSKSV
jgi:c-di-GMP-binding flagellar brake protein YcgR